MPIDPYTGEEIGDLPRLTVRPNPLPVEAYDAATGMAYPDQPQQDYSAVNPAIARLLGVGEGERFQTWPERMARSGFSLPADVYSGAVPIETQAAAPYAIAPGSNDTIMEPRSIPKALGMGNFTVPNAESAIARVQDTSGMAGMSTIGIKPGTATLGSGAVRKEYPTAPRSEWYGEANFENTGGVMKKMTPDEFLSESRPLKIDEVSRENIDLLKQHILEGKTLDPLQLYKGGKEDGRHRAIAAKELGIEEVPVISFREDSKAATGIGAVNQSGYYSTLERTIANSKVQKGTPEQWQAYLKNQPGIKPEELEFSLSNLPNKQLTKAELEAHVAENGIKLGEVWKGGGEKKKFGTPEEQRLATQTMEDARQDMLRLPHGSLEYNDAVNRFVNAQTAMRDIVPGWGRAEGSGEFLAGGDTKFSSYQLPGGSNYRELLLTVPKKGKTLDQISKDMGYGGWPPNNPEKMNEVLAAQDKFGAPTQVNYQSSHWDEPNVLAHIRMNDREIPLPSSSIPLEIKKTDGGRPWKVYVKGQAEHQNSFKTEQEAKDYVNKFPTYEQKNKLKTLHIEEIQSDWHQAGRKQGYNDKSIVNPEGEKRLAELRHIMDNERALTPNELAQYNALNQVQNNTRVPNAPFKKTWDELALKRAITEAAHNGYDAVSWTPGEAQAARYDLSKQISEVHYNKSNGILTAYDHNHNPAIVKNNIKPEHLADIIGKEASEKLMKAKEPPSKVKGAEDMEQYRLKGADLKIGGEGMKAFYDTMLPAKANALIKKMGGKVEYVDSGYLTNKDYKQVIDAVGMTSEQWQALTRDQRAAKIAEFKLGNKIPIIRITPEMREKITKEGFPLYSSGVPSFTPVDDPFKKKEPKLVPVDFNPWTNRNAT